jgi:hypothetical protein
MLWVDMAGSACAVLVLMNDAYEARIQGFVGRQVRHWCPL